MPRYAKYSDPQSDLFDFVEFRSTHHDYKRLNYDGAECYYRDGAWYVPEGYGLPRSEPRGTNWGDPLLDMPGVEPVGIGPVAPATGQKFDGAKDEPGLLLTGCHLAVAGVIAVLGFGFRKYKKRNGWKEVPEAKRRYKDAMHRHLQAIERGELIDPESGKPHIDHVACNAMFLSQMHHEGFW